ncbi:hydrogenase nickel incorporation protein HypB [Amycolatopsis cynarae]|uniref:Hydrogenase nickel incorporation protein HypB n=1 Tax=Amycolatopsis cynarae TaxID=2995223 RepID=A0ABY7BAX7_9PSEU|nr:hydrogenase nickel incorporation protein HypB [Amycolatopsis sp. HUAS 11-8]WAL69306.1 hydrogenase nickel incorporation protein HypB [Amycolatopsis sp. HUAS 11-8]
MCATCGCSDEAGVRIDGLAQPHAHEHGGDHEHEHPHGHGHGHESRTVLLEQDVLAKNDLFARRNRSWLHEQDVLAVNLMSAPGAGKTTLLERTVRTLAAEGPVCVVEGDQETRLDADRVRSAGAPVVQVNTGAGCHLDAAMLRRALDTLDPPAGAVLFVENVGNLVCPALFDLGEHYRVVLLSVTEGQDKPLKYPHMFTGADLVVVNKIDLLPHVDFRFEAFEHDVRSINPRVEILSLSATRGTGLPAWFQWLRGHRAPSRHLTAEVEGTP